MKVHPPSQLQRILAALRSKQHKVACNMATSWTDNVTLHHIDPIHLYFVDKEVH